jgi:hypothetical protein
MAIPWVPPESGVRINPTCSARRNVCLLVTATEPTGADVALNTIRQIMAGWTRLKRWACVLALLMPAFSFGQAIAVPASQSSMLRH